MCRSGRSVRWTGGVGFNKAMQSIAAIFVSRRASVSVLAAVILPVLAGSSGLAAEYGFGLLARVQNQRVADTAAYGGALAYNASASTTAMTSAINRVASLNGLPSTSVSATVVNSPNGDGNQAVRVVVSTTTPRPLSGLLGGAATLPVSAWSYAELKPAGSACIVALSGAGTGLTLSGGTVVSAPACAVASNTSVTVPCGTNITTIVVDYATGASPNALCNAITAPAGKSLTIAHKTTNDPLSGNAGVTAALSHMPSVAAIASPAAPTVAATPTSANNVALSYSPTTPVTFPGGVATYSGSTWTVTCTASCSFGSLTVSGGQNLAFSGPNSATFNFMTAVNTAATTTYGGGNYNFGAGISTTGVTSFGAGTYNVTGSISTSGTTSFGAGTYNVSGGINNSGGATTTFGAGTFNIGAGTCNGGNFSICNSGTRLAFVGPTTLVLASGIYNGGGSTLVFGSGSTANSYRIGSTSGGTAIYGGGGSNTSFGDADGAGLFQVKGMVDVSSGGGSCLALPAAAQHDINGGFATAGGTKLGGGVYTFNGYMALGGNSGGAVYCNGADISLNGTGVTLVISGASLPHSGGCIGFAFCVGAGFNNVTVTSPIAGTTAALAMIGPGAGSGITAGASFSGGASGVTLSGALYFPIGRVAMGGSSSLGNGTSNCLEIIASEITLSGGSTAASTCAGLGSGATSSAVVLVQ